MFSIKNSNCIFVTIKMVGVHKNMGFEKFKLRDIALLSNSYFFKTNTSKNINFIKTRGVFFFNKFILSFLEFFFKNKVLFVLKKGSNKLHIKQISSRVFFNKFFKKKLKIGKQILGLLFYSFLLKDPLLLINFLKKSLEKNKIKMHKRILQSIRKLIKNFFKPIFKHINLLGVFLNIKGKLGVSGSAKKRKYGFFFGKHSITTRTVKMSYKHTTIWTYTGSLGLGLYLFF